jgi:hypothetical protein
VQTKRNVVANRTYRFVLGLIVLTRASAQGIARQLSTANAERDESCISVAISLDDRKSLLRSPRLISSIENVDAAYLNTSFAPDAAVGMLTAENAAVRAPRLWELERIARRPDQQ